MLPLPRLLARASPATCLLRSLNSVKKEHATRNPVSNLLLRCYATGKPHAPPRPPQYSKPTSNSQVRAPTSSVSSKIASKSISPEAKATNLPQKKEPAVLPFTGTHGTLPTTASSATPSGKSAASGYPARLLVYHAGTSKTVFISSVKLTSIFVFIFGAAFLAPQYYYDPASPNHIAGLVVLIGAIPMGFMTLTTAPFVTYVHLALPPWARMSAARLHRLATNLPPSTVLDITTLRWIWPRVTRLTAGELYIKSNAATGAMTLKRRIPKAVTDQRKWWQWRPLSTFFVSGKGGRTAEKGVWEEVTTSISKGWAQKDRDRVIR